MANLKFILDGNGNKIYPITVANGVVYIKADGTQVKLSEYLKDTDALIANAATKVSKATEGNFAGLDANGNITDSGKKAADFATADQGKKADSAIQTLKVNGTALTATDNAVDVLIAEGKTNGTIAANGVDVAVHGLGSAAYTDSSAYDASGAAATAKSDVIGKDGDASSADTIYGAKKYADEAANKVLGNLTGALVYKGTVNANADLPTSDIATGAVYVVATNGTYAGKAMEVGDYLVWNGTSWDGLNGENQVTNDATDLKIGEAVQVATVDGVAINVKQVEDTTKLEAEDSGDTTEYADVSALFKAA